MLDSRQLTEAFPWDTAPRYLLRDRDTSYGPAFRDRVRVLGIEEVVTAPRSPWQNPYVERLIGSIRRERLDHIIIFNESHLHQVLSSCTAGWTCANKGITATRSAGLNQRVEHRLQIERGAADNLEHVGGGGLLLQRLPQLVEQAGVLDCDDGLIGEIIHQLNLFFGEGDSRDRCTLTVAPGQEAGCAT
jgi:hypothetical protein